MDSVATGKYSELSRLLSGLSAPAIGTSLNEASAGRRSVAPVHAALPGGPGGPLHNASMMGTPEADAILCERYRELARRHLKTLPALFTRFTGLLAHVAWAPRKPRLWSGHDLPTHSRVCREAVGGCAETLARCRRCAARHLALTLKSEHKGHRFTCFLQVHNFWLPIIIRGCLVGLAFVQALAQPAARVPMRHQSAPPARARAPRVAAGPSRPACGGTKRVRGSEFGEAARLLRLMFQHVETSSLAELRQSDLTQAQRALAELQTVAARLRRELNGIVPAFNQSAPVLEPEKPAERIVRTALEYIHANYGKAATLRQCASDLGINPAYLSTLFARAVGVPFKTYLTELRLGKARELLSCPTRSISEIAYAVGYASENRFRLAFKAATSLSPKAWRETLRVPPPE